jgi:hypothetical protein
MGDRRPMLIEANETIDNRAGAVETDCGTYLSGVIGTLTRGFETTRGVGTDYFEPGLTVTTRSQQDGGRTAATGTAAKGPYANYAGQNVSAAYVAAEAR